MRLGVFDSGLGGLLIAKAIRERLPEYDMVYLGDTLHVPYGGRSGQAIYEYSRRAMDFLFGQDCQLIIMACNTASATALRPLQQNYLPEYYPQRRILGVIVPTLEEAVAQSRRNIGVLSTKHTAYSSIYKTELKKIDSSMNIHEQAAPLLVPLIENDGLKWLPEILGEYLNPLKKSDIDCLILGCTHYTFLKEYIARLWRDDTPAILSQDEIVPQKLADYLRRHPEIDGPISKYGKADFFVTDLTPHYLNTARQFYGADIEVRQVSI